MFSKIKKVLVSLALASSLALAPMNVSADDTKITLSESVTTGEGIAFVTGSQFLAKYKVEVPASITISLDEASCSQLQVTLMETEDFEENEVLQVKPAFAVLKKEGDDKPEPLLDVVAGQDKEGNDLKDTVTISDLKITDELLKFGTYPEGKLTADSDVARFKATETGPDKAKTISTVVDPDMAKEARRNIPNVTGGTEDPSIADNQQIGTITYACSIVSTQSQGGN